ncbi:MAG TPA: tripartite tricarboxylate transporter substrate binding protein [Burkholderiales bacterium]|nr:tripartite tricarboxylate transporter substrate binding protein [Burkholderiales bacterium]
MSRVRCVAAMLLLGAPAAAIAQEFPVKPVRVIVGPGPDIVARIFGQRFTESWGQQTIVETRPGGGGTVAAETVAKSQADGYTLLLASASYTINAVLQPGAIDLLRDFSPVAFAASSPFLLLVHPSVPARSVKELIALAKARPAQLNYASSGNGTPPHLAGELFKSMAHVNIVHIPYKNAAPAIVDTISGQVQMMFAILPLGLPHVQSGRVRALGVTALKRSTLVSNLPTLSESGLAGYEVIGWNGLLAPAATPKSVVTKINGEVSRALKQGDVPQKLAAVGYEPASENTPEQFAAYLKAEIAKWAKVVKESGAKAD